MTRPRILAFQLLALGGALVVAGLLIEALVRVAGQDRPLVWRPDSRLGWRHIPGARLRWTEEGDGHVEINSLGLRDVGRSPTKPAGTFRIAVFGDSMTEGVQVDLKQTYTQKLEARLRNKGLKVEVLNFGVNGYSPLQGYLLYETVGKSFNPDLVLHAVFTDNDVADCDPELTSGQVGAPFANVDSAGELRIDFSRAEQSASDYDRQPAYTVRRVLATYRMLSSLRRTRAAAKAFKASLGSNAGIPKRYLLYLNPLPARWNGAWLVYEKILEAFSSSVRASGSRFAVVSVPAGQVTDPTVWDNVLAQYPNMRANKWDLLAAERRLQSLTEKHGVVLIQPFPVFRQEIDGAPMFFNGTGPKASNGLGHFTPRGHEVMAQALEDALTKNGFFASTRQ